MSIPIICVSYNSCIDRTLEIENFHIGGQNKGRYIGEQAAGKAVNIAYILSYLGLPCSIYGFVGEDCVKLFEDRLSRVKKDFIILKQRTRVNFTLIDRVLKTGLYFSFKMIINYFYLLFLNCIFFLIIFKYIKKHI